MAFHDRGEFTARVVIGKSVKAGVVVTQGIWWNKYAADRVNCNTTTSTRLTDFGAAATFFDNLVEVAACRLATADAKPQAAAGVNPFPP